MQAHEAGVQLGQQELHHQRLLSQKLEKALQGKASQQQVAADKEAAAAVQAAAHVACLEDTIQRLKVTPNLYCGDCHLAHNARFCYLLSLDTVDAFIVATDWQVMLLQLPLAPKCSVLTA